jgi:hypothetical protein
MFRPGAAGYFRRRALSKVERLGPISS